MSKTILVLNCDQGILTIDFIKLLNGTEFVYWADDSDKTLVF